MHTYHLQTNLRILVPNGASWLPSQVIRSCHELCDVLIPDLFVSTQDTWQPLVVAMETAQCPHVPTDWLPT